MTQQPMRLMSFALEAIECSNRCRHCEPSHDARRRHLSREEVRVWAEQVREQARRVGIEVNHRLAPKRRGA